MEKYAKYYPLGIILCILFLSFGYATFTSKMTIAGIAASVRPEKNIRVTEFYVSGSEHEGLSQWEEYSVNRISSDVNLPYEDSTISYKVQVTNLGGVSMSISEITGLPENLEIEYTDYTLGETLCDDSKTEDACINGAKDELIITIKYKEDGYDSENLDYELRLDIIFECKYIVGYYHLLPDEYQELEYIESSGVQRINTGYIPKTNTKLELEVSFSGTYVAFDSHDGTNVILGSAYTENNDSFSLNFGASESQGTMLFPWFDKSYSSGAEIEFLTVTDSILNNKNTITIEPGKINYSTVSRNIATKTSDQTDALYLFGDPNLPFAGYNMKVYKMILSEDGEIKGVFVPCYRIIDGKVGLYDMVNKEFHANIEEGDDFIKGEEVTNGYHLTQTQKLIYEEPDNLISNTYSRNRYEFTGWNTKTDGSGLSYNDGQKVDDLSASNGETIKLYAMWKEYKTYAGYYIYDVVKENAVLDNVSSKFVENSTGINFFNKSSTSNGNGKYLLADTENDKYPTYYYRGNIKNNNVLFAGHCWKIIRTTNTGGTKLIYNGLPTNGTCDNYGVDTYSDSGIAYALTSIGLSSAGYSYTDKTSLIMSSKASSGIKAGTIFASDIEYVEITDETTGVKSWKYRLTGDKVTSTGADTASFNAERDTLLKDHHYTCFSITDDTCTLVYYVYMTRDNNNYYATLSNGMLLDDLLNIEFNGHSTNTIKSTLHSNVNTWYNNNLTNFEHYIEDTVYCNDRTLYQPWTGTSEVANDVDFRTHFGAKGRVAYTGKVSVNCPTVGDSFTVSSSIGNGALENPIGLITLDEAVLAGYAWGWESTDNYLYTGVSNALWWTMSPGFISATGTYPGIIYSMLDTVAVNYKGGTASDGRRLGGGVRPVISLKYKTTIKSGIGTVDDPFTIEEISYVAVNEIYDANNENQDMLHIGDFVNYDAGTWTQEEIDAIQVGLVDSPTPANNSLDLPTKAYEFGGFAVGTERNSTTKAAQFASLGTVSYLYDAVKNEPITGWRVYDIDETTGEVTLISAGNPEAFYQTNAADAGYSTPYIFSGTIHSSWGETNAAKYLQRDWSPYVNESLGATSAYILSKGNLETWYSKHINVTGDLWTQSNFKAIYSYPRLHNIIDNYSFWWLSSTRAAAGPHFVQGDVSRRLRGGNDVTLGIRVNVVLSSSARFTSKKTGTIEITSEHLTDYGGNQVYNVWDLKELN